ncbi:MAG TPA: hypothetical protein VGQ83_14540 [Polyangia bacterium]|jgi:hypothetical protein
MGRVSTARIITFTLAVAAAGCGSGGGGAGPAEQALRPSAAQRGPAALSAGRLADRLRLIASAAAAEQPAPPPTGAALLAALDVPFKADETRQLVPVEIPAAAAARSCGAGCTQVTALPGDFVADGWENRYNVSGDLLVTNVQIEGATVAVYVDLAAGKAYAFGVIAPELRLQHTNPACLAAVADGGRVAYSCYADRGDGTYASELRLFAPATGQERRLWRLPAGSTVYTMPNGLGFLRDGVSMISAPQCPSCAVIFGAPQTGGPAAQLYPPAGQPQGGVTHGRAADSFLVWTDAQRYAPYVQVAWLDASAGRDAAPRLVATGAVGDRWNPRLKGTRVVWMDTRNDPTHGLLAPQNVDVYARDLVTGTEWAACTHVARQEDPDIEGDLVVWTDYRNNPNPYPTGDAVQSDIYLANVRTGREVRLTALPGVARDPRIDGGRVFFSWKPDDKPAQFYQLDLAALGLTQ